MNPAERLPVTTHLRLVAVIVFICAPHIRNLPLWAIALSLLVMAWSAASALRQWPLPSRLIKVMLVMLAFSGTVLSYGRVIGQTAGVTLLVVMLALKLTELKSHRDRMFTAMLCYFVLITHFLFSQEMLMLPFMIIGAISITAVLSEINHPDAVMPLRQLTRRSAILVAQALPVMLILFVLFPRIPGPLWGLPSDAGAARSGLSESMAPGMISQLSQSDEVAFRVRFDGELPEKARRYWRGPVFWAFDGFTWSPGFRPTQVKDGEPVPPVVIPNGAAFDYEVILEPHRQQWLFALDIPVTLPPGSVYSPERQILRRTAVRERIQYRTRSYTDYQLEPDLSTLSYRLATRLPEAANPRARALAQSWRRDGLSDAEIIARALRLFREQGFTYTLQPPRLGRNSVDEFLFDTRRGFCEHFASAFTSLMRAAGLPARIVTGYQGGELNALGDYMIVRQSDAHAWSEVWLPGNGWLRIDPTAAVAPDRIEFGLGSALPIGEPVPGLARPNANWLRDVQLRWDYVNAAWNEWVLAYGPELQSQVMRAVGLTDWRRMLIAMTLLIVGFLAALGGWLLLKARPHRHFDPVGRPWGRFCKKLIKAGIGRPHHEGPQALQQRIAQTRPDLAEASDEITRLYIELRYLGHDDRQRLRRLEKAVAAFSA